MHVEQHHVGAQLAAALSAAVPSPASPTTTEPVGVEHHPSESSEDA